ncbi:MAG: DUF4040 domain-containing protein [Defluviitaleaceae bacterium]|nr:DUF4040 domain-containing protein [Defluviitaleaceae bacterium]
MYLVYTLFFMLFVSSFMIMFERRVYRIIIYTCVFSLLISLIYLVLGSPDVAMAEAAIGTYAIIFFIVVAERYYGREAIKTTFIPSSKNKKSGFFIKTSLAFVFVSIVAGLFIAFSPSMDANLYLRDQFILRAYEEVGGQNIIGNILMGYRLYDTLFEALALVIAVMAVGNFSWLDREQATPIDSSEVKRDRVAVYSIRIISPIILLFGIYLIINGHISAGGGFQGGVAVACFFICRYMIHNIHDMPVKKVLKLEEIIFVTLVLVAVVAVFFDVSTFVEHEYLTIYQNIHLVVVNSLVGIKVACGFIVLFYRYITIERA